MGCGVSKIDANGMVLPARLRPLFINRLEEISARKHNRTLKDPSHSKKELLLHDRDDDDIASSQQNPKSMPSSPEGSVSGGKKPEDLKGKESKKPKEEASAKESGFTNKDDGNSRGTGKEKSMVADAKVKEIDDHVDADKEDNDEDDDHDHDDDDDDERMISHIDEKNFPGSPSFRVYFKDNEDNDPHDAVKNDAFFKDALSSDDAISSKESSVDQKVIKGERKRRSFKVLPKGGQAAVRNLLNVTSCYHPSHPSHDRAHLLTAKPTT